MSKVEISKVNIKVNDKEILFTLDEAKELQKILNETFGEEKVSFVPYSPPAVIIERERPWRQTLPYWTIDYTWTGTTTGELSLTANSAQ